MQGIHGPSVQEDDFSSLGEFLTPSELQNLDFFPAETDWKGKWSGWERISIKHQSTFSKDRNSN